MLLKKKLLLYYILPEILYSSRSTCFMRHLTCGVRKGAFIDSISARKSCSMYLERERERGDGGREREEGGRERDEGGVREREGSVCSRIKKYEDTYIVVY